MVRFAALVFGVAMLVPAVDALANRESEALRARAADELYNLDRDLALETYRKAIAADPQDAGAYRGLASALWLSITFRRGNMTVDDYMGRVTRPTGPPQPPPPEAAAAFRDAIEKAIAIARRRLDANEKDADAHYQLGAAVGLRASYMATVEGSAFSAFKAAREAYEEHQRVLELDPSRKDAGLIVGTYRYVVSVLALPLRWMAYVAGFDGDKERGMRLVEGASSYPGDNQTDARFALILMYNREKRYAPALEQLAVLRDRYPRNRLAWLESGSTCLRAGRPAEAARFLDEGMARFANETRARMFGEEALWHLKRGTARSALGRTADAELDLNEAVALAGRRWVHGRAHLELGKLALAKGDRTKARREFEAAIELCGSDNDPGSVEDARRLMK